MGRSRRWSGRPLAVVEAEPGYLGGPPFNETLTEASYTVLRPRGLPNAEIRLMMTEIEVRREIFHLITECRKGYSLAGPRIVNDEDADELSWHLFYRMKAKDLLKTEKVDDDC